MTKAVAYLDPDGRVKVRTRAGVRAVFRLLGTRTSRDVEYDFVHRHIAGKGLRILDIGGCDSVLALTLARAGHKVTVYDNRPYPERHPKLSTIRGDFLTNELSDDSFDLIVMVSTLEHIGMGAYGASDCSDADFRVLGELRRVLDRGGKVVLTFPFSGEDRIVPGFERWYTTDRLRRLFADWFVSDTEYWVAGKRLMGRWIKWIPATASEAGEAYDKIGVQGLACFALSVEATDWWRR